MANASDFAPTGAYTIQSAAEQHALLADALAAGTTTVQLAGIDQCDTAGVQLLLSAVLTAQSQQRTLHLSEPSAAVREALQRYGLASIVEAGAEASGS